MRLLPHAVPGLGSIDRTLRESFLLMGCQARTTLRSRLRRAPVRLPGNGAIRGASLLIVKQDLIEFLCERFGLESEGIDDDFPLFSSALLDSIHMVDLVAYLEAQTGVVFEADELSLDNFDSVSAIVFYCQSRSS